MDLRELWEHRAKKELKGRDLSELNVSLAHNLDVGPVFFSEDALKPDFPEDLFSHIDLSFSEEFEQDDNVDLKLALNEGLNEPIFLIDQFSDPQKIFNGVQLEWIKFGIEYSKKSEWIKFEKAFLDYLNRSQINLESLNFYHRYRSTNLIEIQEGDLVEQLVGLLNKIYQETQIDSPPTDYILQLAIAEDQLIQIAKFRSIRILLFNLNSALNLKTNFFIEGIVNLEGGLGDGLVSTTSKILTAKLGKLDRVIHRSKNANSDYLRHCRNIYYMLKEEGRMSDTIDPAEGSLLLDNMTNELCMKAWMSFVKDK